MTQSPMWVSSVTIGVTAHLDIPVDDLAAGHPFCLFA